MINVRTMTKRFVNSCKHKRCKTRTTKIKITVTKRVANSCSQEREGRWRSTWRLWLRGSQATTRARDARWGPPRSRSQRLGGSLVIVVKREQAWSAWALNDSIRKLYQQHHDHLSSKEKKHAQNFGRCRQRRRWWWPRSGHKIRVSLSLALSPLIENHVYWNQRWIFLCLFLFILMMHSIFVKGVVMFGHGSLNICSCMSRMMLMRCWMIKEFSWCVFDPSTLKYV